MKYVKPFSEFEKFAVVDVITTSDSTGGEGDGSGDLPPIFD